MSVASYDVVIVGAGILGGLTAWRVAAKFPTWKVLWIEKGSLGSGATAYSAGLITPLGTNDQLKALALRSKRLYSELALHRELPIQEKTGWMLTNRDFAHNVLSWFISGATPRVSATPDALAKEDLPDDFTWENDDVWLGPFDVAQVRPIQLMDVLRDLFLDGPSTALWEGVEVLGWNQNTGGLNLRLSSGPIIWTRRLVLATGAWGDPNHVGIRLKKVAAAHVEQAPPARAPVVMFPSQDAFLLPLQEEKRWLFSFPSEEWDVSPSTVQLQLTERDHQSAAALLRRYSPLLAQSVHGGRVFCDAYAQNRVPVLKQLSLDPLIVYVGAGSGSGIRLGAALAEDATSLLDATA